MDQSSLRLLWLTILGSIALGFVLSRYHLGAMSDNENQVLMSGLALIVVGLVVRWTAILSLWSYFTVDVSIDDTHRLVTTGIYKFVRHPAYTGSLLSFVGLGLVFLNWLSLVIIVLPITIAFVYRIKVEEQALVAFFGDQYVRYCETTRRLIPKIY